MGGAGGIGGAAGMGGMGSSGIGGAAGMGGMGSSGIGGAAGMGGMEVSSSSNSSGMGGAGGKSGNLCVTNGDCDDGFSCTTDVCNMGGCSHVPVHAACNDGLYCNGTEACNPAVGAMGTGCTPPSGSPCDDGVGGTGDAWNEANDSCSHTADNSLCSNGVVCDGVETCHSTLGCINGTPLDCDDKITCTNDYCDLQMDACAHVENDTLCTNNLFCDGVETCNKMLGCVAGTLVDCDDNIMCTADSCDEANDSCNYVPSNQACSDGLYCNGVETCVVGVGCQAGSPIVCNDNLSCTADSCNEITDSCNFAPNDIVCDDGFACNGVETCSVAGPVGTGCIAGTAVQCPNADGMTCTEESCQEPNGACIATPNSGLCNTGQNCIPPLGCIAATACTMNSQCDDGNACNGVETCNGVFCVDGAPKNCNDLFPCTIDTCNEQTGACEHAPINAICDDGSRCNGVEACDVNLGCTNPPDIDCNDGVTCTMDQCTEPNGTCAHISQDFACDDGLFCNGAEVCGPNGCLPGTPPTCNDGIACTTDSCDDASNACKAVPNNALCGCGETCSPQAGGCGNFCTVATCQGKVYACGDCADNDGDCKIDSQDNQCLGPCDNTENSFYGGISGQNNSPCKSDCYFDQDTGAGNDDCYWSHKCDALEVSPNYPPEGSQCSYNPNANIPGYSGSCMQAYTTQSQACLNYCGPLTPNGCDCFGCCHLPGIPYTVWLGSENPSGVGSCNINTINDPTKCKPCTQVQACINTCDTCEICVGQTQLPPGCTEQVCPPGVQKCGQVGQPPCPAGYSCITGCCIPSPSVH